MAEQKTQQKDQDINSLLKVRREKLENLQNEGKNPFVITKYDVTHHSAEIKEQYDVLEGQTVSLAGRMMFKRVMGKASFCNIQDLQGKIQAYVARDSVGEDSYKDFKKYDVGDILGIKGTVLQQKLVRFLFMPKKSHYFPRACRFYQKSIMGLRIRIPDTVSVMLILL